MGQRWWSFVDEITLAHMLVATLGRLLFISLGQNADDGDTDEDVLLFYRQFCERQ